MAQAIPQYHQFDAAHQQRESTFVVVDQQPCQREVFPYRLQVNWIFGFSIVKFIVGSLLFVTGIVHLVVIQYDTHIGVGIWCGFTTGAFYGLSIISLIFDAAMLSFYGVILDYFINVQRRFCYYYGRYWVCYGVRSSVKDAGIGVTAFLVFLALFELGCSIGSVVLSCKAYSKCCTTCDDKDCCTCLGCCECDCRPLNLHQGSQPSYPPSCSHHNTQVSSASPRTCQCNTYQQQLNTNAQAPSPCNAQPVRNNPCSGLVSFVVNMPAYLFGGPNGAEFSGINLNVQPVRTIQHCPTTEQGTGTEQVNTAFLGSMQQIPPILT